MLRDRGLGRYLHHVAVDTVDGYQVACDNHDSSRALPYW